MKQAFLLRLDCKIWLCDLSNFYFGASIFPVLLCKTFVEFKTIVHIIAIGPKKRMLSIKRASCNVVRRSINLLQLNEKSENQIQLESQIPIQV